MSEETLLAIVRAEKAAAMGETSGQGTDSLSAQRSKNMDYYLGDMTEDMPSLEGRSKAVSTDVADTVDGIMPALIDIFMGSEEVARFNPIGPEDEDAAQQETDYVNHVFYVENEGFITLHAMMKDGLIQKNGVVKYWWEEGEKEERESYRSLTDEAFNLIVADKSVEVIEHTARDLLAGPDGAQIGVAEGIDVPKLTVHDCVVIRRKPYGCVKIKAVPPEEFLIAKDARNIKDARYCAHKVVRTASDLIGEGHPQSLVDELSTGTTVPTVEQQSRATVDDTSEEVLDNVNRAMRPIEVTESYIRVDFDGDGIAELMKVKTAGSGDKLLDHEPYDGMPFAGITPILMPHRFWGRALADITTDIQKIKTALLRAVLDNAYFMNNGRWEISEQHMGDYTLDDLLTNRPNQIVRTKMPGGLNLIAPAPIAQHIFPVMEYMDGVREVRTGVQKNAPGDNTDAINPFKQTATAVVQMVSHTQQRIRMIARTFAETGIKDVMLGIHELILKHGTEARQVKLRNEWVEIDPREWKTRKDMTVSVGLGTGTRDQQMQSIMQILQMQIQAITLQGGPAVEGVKPGIVTIENVYNTLRKLVEIAGLRSADPFFVKPTDADKELLKQIASQPKQDPLMAKVQADTQAKQIETQAKIEGKRAEMAMDYENEQKKMALAAQRDQQQQQADNAMAQMNAMLDQRLAKYKADQEAELALYKANLEAKVAIEIGAMQAASNERVHDTGRPGGVVD